MPTPGAPFRLLPAFHERPWGVRSLAPWFDLSPVVPVGEAWFTAGACGTSLGRPLGDLLAADPARLLGDAAFPGGEPLLLKLLFTSDRLSVQVHPDDDYARRHHGSAGKTEAWHVVQALPGAAVGLGFVEPLAPDTAREAARTGAIEHLLAWHPARQGDTFLVPAGTVHAIGAGLVIVEVQEPSDVTYRLYDYGRPRELHLEHGFAVADLGPYRTVNAPVSLSPGRTLLARCPFFTMERVVVEGSRRWDADEPFYHLVVTLAGEGTLDGLEARPGSVFFVPASATGCAVEGRGLHLLVAYTADHPSRAMMGW
jgi:mannose-6-phosphate isomerase